MEHNITIFNNINILLLKKNNHKFLIIYSKYIYYKLSVNKSIFFYFNKNCRTLVLKSININNDLSSVSSLISLYNYSMLNYFVKKIYFSGKSYKIKKCKENFTFEFNKSHIDIFVWKNNFLKKLKKNKILIKNVNYNTIRNTYIKIIKIRKINPFTQRGLRGSRTFLKKKIGKKSN